MSRSYVSQIKPVRSMPTGEGWTLRRHVADATPSPTCEREGHVWGTPKHNGIPAEDVTVRVCTRCAKRGAYVFLTEWSSRAEEDGRRREVARARQEAERLRRRLAELEALVAA